MRLATLIETAMARRGISASELARRLGIKTSTVTRILAGKRIGRADTIAAIADELQLDSSLVQAAIRGEKEARPPRRRTPQEIIRELEDASPILVPEVTGRVSAGPGSAGEIDYWPYLPEPGERSHKFIVVAVSGDCMEPRLHDGERVIVDTDASPRPGDIVVAEHDDERIIKLLEKRNGDTYLVALRRHQPLKVDERTRVVGVVKFAGRHRP